MALGSAERFGERCCSPGDNGGRQKATQPAGLGGPSTGGFPGTHLALLKRPAVPRCLATEQLCASGEDRAVPGSLRAGQLRGSPSRARCAGEGSHPANGSSSRSSSNSHPLSTASLRPPLPLPLSQQAPGAAAASLGAAWQSFSPFISAAAQTCPRRLATAASFITQLCLIGDFLMLSGVRSSKSACLCGCTSGTNPGCTESCVWYFPLSFSPLFSVSFGSALSCFSDTRSRLNILPLTSLLLHFSSLS